MSDLDHHFMVFSGILPDRPDMLVEALRWLEPEHFPEEHGYRSMWLVLTRFYELSGGVPTRRFISELPPAKNNVSRTVVLSDLWDRAAETRVSDFEVKASIQLLRELRSEQLTGEALTRGLELLTRGGEIDGKEVPPGHRSAWRYVAAEQSRIDLMGSLDSAPEGDVFTDTEAALSDYEARKRAALDPVGVGVRTGLREIDKATGGFQPGDFALIVGYTNAGKSMLTTQTSWYTTVHQAKNVFYATSETTREMTRRRILARHSRLERFGLKGGLDSKKMRDGSLSAAEEKVLRDVIADLSDGVKTGRYGKLYVAQVPPGATWNYVANAARRLSMQFKIDLVVIDYLALLRPDRRRDSPVTEYADMLKGVKVFATSFEEGKGVPVLSPWAVKQEAYKTAKERREYSLASLADASEAEKTPDHLVYLLGLDDEPKRVRCGFLKNRDGEIPPQFAMEVDFSTTYLGDIQGSVATDALEKQLYGMGAR